MNTQIVGQMPIQRSSRGKPYKQEKERPVELLESIGLKFQGHGGQHKNNIQCVDTVNRFYDKVGQNEKEFLSPFKCILDSVSEEYPNRFDGRFLKPVMELVSFHWDAPLNFARLKKVLSGINVYDFISEKRNADDLIDLYNYRLKGKRLSYIKGASKETAESKPAKKEPAETVSGADAESQNQTYAKIGQLFIEFMGAIKELL